MDVKTHEDVEVRIDDSTAKRLDRIATQAEVTRDQAASVLFALWCLHNLPEESEEPQP